MDNTREFKIGDYTITVGPEIRPVKKMLVLFYPGVPLTESVTVGLDIIGNLFSHTGACAFQPAEIEMLAEKTGLMDPGLIRIGISYLLNSEADWLQEIEGEPGWVKPGQIILDSCMLGDNVPA